MATRTEDLPPVQQASKRLLGGAYSLEIGAWIRDFGGVAPINPTDLRQRLASASEAPPTHSSVVKELENLVAARLLAPLKIPGRDVYFERRDSVYFEMCWRLRDEVMRRTATADNAASLVEPPAPAA